MSARLALAAEAEALPSGPDNRVLILGAPFGLDLSPFGASSVTIVQDTMPDAQRWQDAGLAVVSAVPEECFDAVLVCLPRAKEAARARIADAMRVARTRVLVDGQKTDGIEAILKDMRRHVEIEGVVSKAHGKLFWSAPSDAFAAWQARPGLVDDTWHTAPGVFSAGHVDPGSALLAAHIPLSLSGSVVDLGAGWGYLSAELLKRCPGIARLHLVEAQGLALDCARNNVTDPRAAFHWADATTWAGVKGADAIVMNPPFHTSRAADPDLGRAFITSAARLLKPGGRLYMVANRHLPYETSLREAFAEVIEIGGTSKFKLLSAKQNARVKR
jgi:16S rRNA (guanine1207-N2)-methyltransferase